jgi:hypothetical protein
LPNLSANGSPDSGNALNQCHNKKIKVCKVNSYFIEAEGCIFADNDNAQLV